MSVIFIYKVYSWLALVIAGAEGFKSHLVDNCTTFCCKNHANMIFDGG